MEELMQELIKFQTERDWEQFHTPENLAKSISIEAAELLEHFQWNNEYNKEEVVDELADVLNYCFLMADALDVNVKEIVLNKMEKTAKKYPIEKAKGISTKYDKL
ncbi:nucleotide pyrophosphohydrolase [uncultured Methanobrevibacter sp.]|uniref:nucleotide pyrophosphohydrolase n=1 Tax=uncultured Methanobrevibacter sp. TaxID=253161 RepID=UPI0025F5B723|nr:nucleotide pyrophosphohydrolase [uncultured Methanobrevibacter sp.]